MLCIYKGGFFNEKTIQTSSNKSLRNEILKVGEKTEEIKERYIARRRELVSLLQYVPKSNGVIACRHNLILATNMRYALEKIIDKYDRDNTFFFCDSP